MFYPIVLLYYLLNSMLLIFRELSGNLGQESQLCTDINQLLLVHTRETHARTHNFAAVGQRLTPKVMWVEGNVEIGFGIWI